MFKMFQQKSKDVVPPGAWTLPEDMTLEQARVEMVGLLAQDDANHHRLGVLYNYVVDKKLAELAGFKDARDWATQNLGEVSQASLTLYGTVAHQFSEEVAQKFGMAALYLLLTYKELAGVKVDHDEPGPTLIDVPDAKGVVTTKPFSACSVAELRRALQAKRKPTSSKPLPPAAVTLADQVSKAVASRFQKGDPVKVQLRNHLGTAVLDFRGIPLEKLAKLVEALTADGGAALKARQ